MPDLLDAKVARVATGRRCPLECGEFLTAAEAVDGCPRCHAPRPYPSHTTWPPVLKKWIVAQLLARTFHPWLDVQAVWERLLRDGLQPGATARPEHYAGKREAASLYAAALSRAEQWARTGAVVAGSAG